MTPRLVAGAAARTLGDELWSVFEAVVRHDTATTIGEHAMDAHDPRIASFMAAVGVPLLTSCGATTRINHMNNVIGTFGPLTGNEIVFVAYPVNHHGNYMTAPLRARRSEIKSEEHWLGLGASQGKGGLTSLIAALKLASRAGAVLAGNVAVALCSEGSSTHKSSVALFENLTPRPRGAILTIGTGNQLCLGNRGRLDVIVDIHGTATHSSAADLGSNPIPLVGTVLDRLAGCASTGDEHPLLGPRTQIPYRLVCGPIAPHTLPQTCQLVLDRRFLPGDEPDQVCSEIRHALAGLPVTVSKGPLMMPALVDPAERLVRELQQSAETVLGHALPVIYPRYTFDAGYPCSIGIPTVMVGPSSPELSTTGVLGDDHVAAEQLNQAAQLYAALAMQVGEAR